MPVSFFSLLTKKNFIIFFIFLFINLKKIQLSYILKFEIIKIFFSQSIYFFLILINFLKKANILLVIIY